MLDEIHEECGVAAVYRMGHLPEKLNNDAPPPAGDNVSHLIPRMLLDLQNRGQLAAGITSYNPERDQIIDTWKDNGPVGEVFRTYHAGQYQALMGEYAGRAAIGHVRYATCGREEASFAQPFERHHGRKWKWFSFCFNGNIANYSDCRDRILSRGDYHLVRETDTEIIMHHLALALQGDQKPDLVTVFRHLNDTFDGAFCIAFLNADGDLVVARDAHGFRPLCYAIKGNLFAAASESLALANLGFDEIRNVEPGTLIHVTANGPRFERFAESQRQAFCFFEWVYFSNVASVLNGKSVYESRRRMGEELARTETEKLDPDCVVVPVPDTARAAADAMAFKLGIPVCEGLLRNRYMGRTFIEGNNRYEKAIRKYAPIPEILQGKRVFLVEDSIVRSTTLRAIIRMIREKGRAREIHVRVAAPPIMAPCCYGIDMSTVRELFAPRFLEKPYREEIPRAVLEVLARDLGANSLRYLAVEALPRCIGIPAESLCMACLTGEYPTEWGSRLYQIALKEKDQKDDGRRTYE